jgi:hypothetical protein
LSELGHDCVKNILLPLIRPLGEKIKSILEATSANQHVYASGQSAASAADKVAAEHVRTITAKACAAAMVKHNLAPDTLDEFRAEYGYLAPFMHAMVVKFRASTPGGATAVKAQRVAQAAGGI